MPEDAPLVSGPNSQFHGVIPKRVLFTISKEASRINKFCVVFLN